MSEAEYRHTVEIPARKATLVFVTSTPLSREQVVRAANLYVRMRRVGPGEHVIPWTMWTADDLALLEMEL